MADHSERIEPLPEISLILSAEETTRLSPVHDAVMEDDAQKLAALIYTLNPSILYEQRQLFPAVAWGKVAAARCLFEHGVEIDSQIIFAACYKTKSVEMFEQLIDYGWNINAAFGRGGTPALALVVKDEQLVRCLLDNGANPNIGRKDRWNSCSEFSPDSGEVLDFVACGSTIKLFDLLLERGAKLGSSLALHNAASAEFTEERKKLMMRLIEDHGVDVNQMDTAMGPRRVGTPLFYAAIGARG